MLVLMFVLVIMDKVLLLTSDV